MQTMQIIDIALLHPVATWVKVAVITSMATRTTAKNFMAAHDRIATTITLFATDEKVRQTESVCWQLYIRLFHHEGRHDIKYKVQHKIQEQ